MSENEWNSECNTFLENSTAPTIRESTIKCSCCKTLKNRVCYYQTPFDIALILEQVSNHNVMLIEKIRIEKDIRIQQHDVIGDVKIVESKLSAKSKECMHEWHEEKRMMMIGTRRWKRMNDWHQKRVWQWFFLWNARNQTK